MNIPSALVSGSTRSSRAILTCVFYHPRADAWGGEAGLIDRAAARTLDFVHASV
jgi:hypothetical protein